MGFLGVEDGAIYPAVLVPSLLLAFVGWGLLASQGLCQ